MENNEVFIPNGKILSDAVVNYSLPDEMVVRKLVVGVSYHVAPNKVKSTVLEVLGGCSGRGQVSGAGGAGDQLRDFAVHYEIRYPLADFSTHVDTEAEIMKLLWYRFKRSGIDIPMPIRDIHLKQITPESVHAEQERRAAEIVGLMEKVEILTALSKPELNLLVAKVRIETYASGEVPVRQGESGGFVLYHQERQGERGGGKVLRRVSGGGHPRTRELFRRDEPLDRRGEDGQHPRDGGRRVYCCR